MKHIIAKAQYKKHRKHSQKRVKYISVSLFLLLRLKVKVKGNVREKNGSAPTVRPSAPIFSEDSKSSDISLNPL